VWWITGTSGVGHSTNPHFCGGVSGSTQYNLAPGTYTFWIGNQNPVTVG
jgi:hypothetical protein